MSEQHNTNTSNMSQLPSVGIVISGLDALVRKKSVESIKNHTYDNY